MSIVLIGMKGCGKTTVGHLLAQKLHLPFLDADREIERVHRRETGEALPFRDIFSRYGAAYFQRLDTATLQHVARVTADTKVVFACGGRTPLLEENQETLRKIGTIIFLNAEKAVLLRHISAQGMPAFFRYKDEPEHALDELLQERLPVYQAVADIVVAIGEETPEQVAGRILEELRKRDED